MIFFRWDVVCQRSFAQLVQAKIVSGSNMPPPAACSPLHSPGSRLMQACFSSTVFLSFCLVVVVSQDHVREVLMYPLLLTGGRARVWG